MTKKSSILSIVLAITWTLFIITMVNLVGVKEERLINQIALSQGQTLYQIIVDMRSWSAAQGGVYVVPSEYTPPNPYLVHPKKNIETTDGMKLTLVNPSYMTRQISDIGLKRRGVKTRITNLHPTSPTNQATDWEREALETFEDGQSPYFNIVEDEEGGAIYRYMAPLKLEEPCKDCHTVSQWPNGILGGISITFPVEDLYQSRIYIMRLNRATFASIWLVGLLVIAGLSTVLDKILPGWIK